MNDIKVLMIGGRNCGKTSILAGLFEQVINGSLRQPLSLCDQTIYDASVDGELTCCGTLTSKLIEMEDILNRADDSVFMMDSGNYPILSTTRRLGIFAPGENLKEIQLIVKEGIPSRLLDKHQNHELDDFLQYDIAIVTIDTPYLMECNDDIARNVNEVEETHRLLEYTTYNHCHKQATFDNRFESARMVIFVPVKCEKWVKSRRTAEIKDRIKDIYGNTIRYLSYFSDVTVAIMPVLTAGSIEFAEMKEPYLLMQKCSYFRKCARITEQIVRLSDGRCHSIRDDEILCEDQNSPNQKPNAWYRISEHIYNPVYCDCLLLRMLQFWASKISSSRYLSSVILEDPFGRRKAQREWAIRIMRICSDYFKHNQDRIEYLHRATFEI